MANRSSKEMVKDFLEERKSILREALEDRSGIRTARWYADLMDRFVRSLFFSGGFARMRGTNPDDLAVVALGGYGRRELCGCSDVDVMVIHRGQLSKEAKEMISRAIYPLWDAKLDVGQSILTYRECIRLALSDFRVFTSLLDSRFLLGSISFFRLFQEAFWSRIYRERSSLLPKFLISREQRAEKYGDEGYFVEPDLKEGLGGLRDLHLMGWMARTYFKCFHLTDIKRFSMFSHFELDKLSASRGMLLNVRNHLHYLTDRKEDRLLLSSQDKISQILGYTDSPHNSKPEQLMRDLYLHLNRIRYRCEEFQVKVLDIIDPPPTPSYLNALSPEFMVVKGNVVLREGSIREKDPIVILKALKEANERDLFLGSGFIWEAKTIIADQGKKLKDSPEALVLFLRILLNPRNAEIVRLALEIGLIGLFIPEFRRIRNLVEFGFYHVMTVDLHSLKALDTVKEISLGAFDERWPMFRKVFQEIRHPDWLYVAVLLHDIGKGSGPYHAQKGSEFVVPILKRLGMEAALAAIPFLVKHHLLLANISQRRDLSDEKTSIQVAQVIQDQEILRMLFLLTVADSFATGPMARSEWKIMLLIELFMKVSGILEKGTLASPDAARQVETKKQAIVDALKTDFTETEVNALMDQVSPRYFLSATVADGIEHFHMALNMRSGHDDRRHVWTLHQLKDAPVTRIIQCTYDKPGLFSQMVGVFALNNIKILSANIFTLKNGLAFDIYEVTNPIDPYREAERWEKTLMDVHSVLDDRLSLEDLIREKEKTLYGEAYHPPVHRRVRIDNDASDFFTVIEVRTGTGVGLTYAMAKQIFLLGLDIRFAKLNSDEERVMGVFYVRDADGQKLFEDERIAAIKDEIMKVGG